MKLKMWAKNEIEFLKNNYNRIGYKEIGELLGRTHSGVLHKAQKLNLKNGYMKSEVARKRMSRTRKSKIKSGDNDIKLFTSRNNPIYDLAIKKKVGMGISKAWAEGRYDETMRDRKGIHYSPETEFKKGNISHNRGRTKEDYEPLKRTSEKMKGREFSDSHRLKISKSKEGDKCTFWQGGISNEPYDGSFNKTKKREIKLRDKYLCFLCFKKNKYSDLHVHHIDYNKKNSSLDNLICLCKWHHPITNTNREFWQRLFTYFMVLRNFHKGSLPTETIQYLKYRYG